MSAFIDFSDPRKKWKLNLIADIIEKVKAYADKNGYKDVVLLSVEDNTWNDPKNQRFDVEIATSGNPQWQKLLFLKGELLDGNEFHERFNEFYPET